MNNIIPIDEFNEQHLTDGRFLVGHVLHKPEDAGSASNASQARLRYHEEHGWGDEVKSVANLWSEELTDPEPFIGIKINMEHNADEVAGYTLAAMVSKDGTATVVGQLELDEMGNKAYNLVTSKKLGKFSLTHNYDSSGKPKVEDVALTDKPARPGCAIAPNEFAVDMFKKIVKSNGITGFYIDASGKYHLYGRNGVVSGSQISLMKKTVKASSDFLSFTVPASIYLEKSEQENTTTTNPPASMDIALPIPSNFMPASQTEEAPANAGGSAASGQQEDGPGKPPLSDDQMAVAFNWFKKNQEFGIKQTTKEANKTGEAEKNAGKAKETEPATESNEEEEDEETPAGPFDLPKTIEAINKDKRLSEKTRLAKINEVTAQYTEEMRKMTETSDPEKEQLKKQISELQSKLKVPESSSSAPKDGEDTGAPAPAGGEVAKPSQNQMANVTKSLSFHLLDNISSILSEYGGLQKEDTDEFKTTFVNAFVGFDADAKYRVVDYLAQYKNTVNRLVKRGREAEEADAKASAGGKAESEKEVDYRQPHKKRNVSKQEAPKDVTKRVPANVNQYAKSTEIKSGYIPSTSQQEGIQVPKGTLYYTDAFGREYMTADGLKEKERLESGIRKYGELYSSGVMDISDDSHVPIVKRPKNVNTSKKSSQFVAGVSDEDEPMDNQHDVLGSLFSVKRPVNPKDADEDD